MKQKVSDYIADYIAEWGIRDVFTVTGGGAMHMNDAFGHHPKLHCTYQHHEQACAMAAEAYARMDNRMAAVCVTTGPGATNAITGVLGGWMDSIPMLVFSGQARYATTVAASGLKLRSMGVQECNIVPVVTSITKYAQMIIHPEDIRYHLEKALYMAVNGRPGPVWLDIPLDVQGAVIDTEKLRGYDPQENPKEKPAEISQDIIQQILDKIEKSRRPVLFPGNGVRLAGAMDDFQKLVNILDALVVSSGLQYTPKLYIVEDSQPNAFATGRNPENAVICVTTGLLDKLSYYELEGVIAHEMAHIKNYDIRLSAVVSVMVGFVVILSDWFTRISFYGGSRRRDDDDNGNPILMFIGLIFLILAPIFGQLMQLALSRKREFLADATAIEFTRNPDGLISALLKISGDPNELKVANNATENMYIVNPFRGKKSSSSLWSTHPSIEDRVEALRNIK